MSIYTQLFQVRERMRAAILLIILDRFFIGYWILKRGRISIQTPFFIVSVKRRRDVILRLSTQTKDDIPSSCSAVRKMLQHQYLLRSYDGIIAVKQLHDIQPAGDAFQ